MNLFFYNLTTKLGYCSLNMSHPELVNTTHKKILEENRRHQAFLEVEKKKCDEEITTEYYNWESFVGDTMEAAAAVRACISSNNVARQALEQAKKEYYTTEHTLALTHMRFIELKRNTQSIAKRIYTLETAKIHSQKSLTRLQARAADINARLTDKPGKRQRPDEPDNQPNKKQRVDDAANA